MTGMKDEGSRRGSVPAKPEGLGTTSEIGRKLKQYYDELVTEEVPDKFMDLLRQLENKEADAGASRGPAKD